MLAIWYGFVNRILRHDTAVVLDIYVKVRARKHALPELQDLRKTI
jgi:hypothetical protein